MTLTLTQLIVYIVIAVVSAYLAGAIFGTRYPSGFLGAFLASLIGEWLMINVLHVLLAPEVSYGGVPIITAVVGALILAFLWAVVAGSRHHRRWI
ncbi:MAG: GlsB/YeaQ/YmgE family stress response membrane protein [Chloroflexota bacterium]|nr:GlsB/YeaQ/YmgE family stress response membrane protein [Chloroflexota bacterium]